MNIKSLLYSDPDFEKVEMSGEKSFRLSRVRCSAFQDDHSWHYHHECQLTYIVKGNGRRFIADSVEEFSAGSLVFVSPYVPHCWVSDAQSTENEMITLQFSPYCLGQDFLSTPESNALTQLVQRGGKGLEFGGPNVSHIFKQLELCENASGLQGLALFFSVLALLTKSEMRTLASETYLVENQEFRSGRIEKVIDYLKNNMSHAVEQADVASHFNMTPQSFSRYFKSATGETFVGFYNRLRIVEASRLLVLTNDEIINVAMRCGYKTITNFNRRFKEVHHVSPSEFRRKAKTELFNASLVD